MGKPEYPQLEPHARIKMAQAQTDWPLWGFGNRHMGRLVLGRPGPVTHKEERGKKREKEERKKERMRKKRQGKKRGEEREEDLRPIWASYSVFKLCTSLYTRPLI